MEEIERILTISSFVCFIEGKNNNEIYQMLLMGYSRGRITFSISGAIPPQQKAPVNYISSATL